MAHYTQKKFVRTLGDLFPEFFTNTKVLEIGSYGSVLKDYFRNCRYVGIDVVEGPGIDIVISGHNFSAETGSFGCALSCECFEHNPFWLETFVNMIRVTKPGGLVMFTCAAPPRGEHGTTRSSPITSPSTSIGWDYYKNLTAQDFVCRINMDLHFYFWEFFHPKKTEDLYFYGFKAGSAPVDLIELRTSTLRSMVTEIYDMNNNSQIRSQMLRLKKIMRFICGSEDRYQNAYVFISRIKKLLVKNT